MQDMENTEIEVTEDLDNIDETAASDTLKPMGAPGESKAAMLATMTQLMAQLGMEDLSDIFNQVQAQYGPNNAPGAQDNSDSNKNSIKSGGAAPADPMPTLGVKEDVEEMFSDEDLSEEFKERAEVVFEAALNTRLTLEKAKLAEEFEELRTELEESFAVELQEKSAEIFTDLSEKLDQYLDYAVSQWMEENKLAVDNGLRADIAENFIKGLHNLFAESYIKVPEESFDIVAEMKSDIEDLKAKLDEALDENMELRNSLAESTRDDIIDEISEGLTVTQTEKLRALAEGIAYSDAETYRKKLGIVKENYFTKKTGATTGLINEEIDGEADQLEEAVNVPSNMKHYVEAITKTISK